MSSIRHDQAHRPGLDGSISGQSVAREKASRGTLSIVIPAKNEAANLPELVTEILLAFRPLVGRVGGHHPLEAFEIVVVEDGSTDPTGEVLRELNRMYPEVRPVTLARNVGQSAATVAGFRASRGDWVGMLDADLQNPPASLAMMWDALPGYDAALGWRTESGTRCSARGSRTRDARSGSSSGSWRSGCRCSGAGIGSWVRY